MARLANCEATRIEIREKALRNALKSNTYGTRATFSAGVTVSLSRKDIDSMSPELFDKLVSSSVAILS